MRQKYNLNLKGSSSQPFDVRARNSILALKDKPHLSKSKIIDLALIAIDEHNLHYAQIIAELKTKCLYLECMWKGSSKNVDVLKEALNKKFISSPVEQF